MTRLMRSALILIWVHMIGTAERQSFSLCDLYGIFEKLLSRPLTVAAGGNSIIPQPSQFVNRQSAQKFCDKFSQNLCNLNIDFFY